MVHANFLEKIYVAAPSGCGLGDNYPLCRISDLHQSYPVVGGGGGKGVGLKACNYVYLPFAEIATGFFSSKRMLRIKELNFKN